MRRQRVWHINDHSCTDALARTEEVKAKEAAKRKKEEMKAAKQAFEKHLLERELR